MSRETVQEQRRLIDDLLNSDPKDHQADQPAWAERIGRSTLVIIDEAGMADTHSLDTAVQLIIGRAATQAAPQRRLTPSA